MDPLQSVDVRKPPSVAVWWMRVGLPSYDIINQWYASLDAAERGRAKRFRFDGDRLAYVAAHWLLRSALASVGGRPASEWRFVVETLGKPRIDPTDGLPVLHFSLSHTKGLVACAVCDTTEIGIDVETFAPGKAIFDIASRFFSTSEVMCLHRAPPDQQMPMFFRLWTLKEAFIKATGEGLHRSLRSFSFSLEPLAIAFPPCAAEQPAQWQFLELRPTDSHLLALAIRWPRDMPISLFVQNIDCAKR